MTDRCCVCKAPVDTENAPMLTMSGFGIPRYMCGECSADFDEATTATDFDAIKAALDRIGEKIPLVDVDDKITLAAIAEIMKGAKERAKAIENGTYDFGADAPSDDEIPEELLETEEDRELDRRDAEKVKKIDTIMNYVCAAAVVGAVGFLIYTVIKLFF